MTRGLDANRIDAVQIEVGQQLHLLACRIPRAGGTAGAGSEGGLIHIEQRDRIGRRRDTVRRRMERDVDDVSAFVDGGSLRQHRVEAGPRAGLRVGLEEAGHIVQIKAIGLAGLAISIIWNSGAVVALVEVLVTW